MGEPHRPSPVLLIAAITSRHESARQWAVARAIDAWGDLALRSSLYPFDQTRYYESTMGSNLRKQIVAFAQHIDPAQLVEIKLTSNAWEQDLAASREYAETRPVNIDPGYLTPAKLVLATTKDRDHRLYLGHGVYGEVTLYFQNGQWWESRWTYPDYVLPEVLAFLTDCRRLITQR